MTWSIVGRRFTPETFEEYVSAQSLQSWKPECVVLHNTAIPSLAQRPNGFTQQHIHNLHGFYMGKGWSGCPHLFVDQNGIWVLNPLDRPGIHSPSWNRVSWGVEMLGDFNREPFHSGPGALVRDNALAALATLCRAAGLPADAIRFHKEDPKTTHKTCPGNDVRKDWVQGEVARRLGVTEAPPAKLVLYRHGLGDQPAAVLPIEIRQSRAFAREDALGQATGIPATGSGMVAVKDFLGNRYSLKWVPATRRVYAVEL